MLCGSQGCWWRRRPCLVLSSWGVQGPDAPGGAQTPQGGSAGWVCSPMGSMSARWVLASRSPEKPRVFQGTPPGLLRTSSTVCVMSLAGCHIWLHRGAYSPHPSHGERRVSKNEGLFFESFEKNPVAQLLLSFSSRVSTFSQTFLINQGQRVHRGWP